ncbi:protein-disulfide reductase DsbD [Cycloclasticus pugetii]|uniref:protein-disulfide reductase DsbD n=1 Tax=Cycloclasticus pugetii TaxID=34068 RepID=UPI0009163698|nr:protein-disulfide reductase DsbD [Cycloclasticus pugetii]SHI61523.1 thiol:disulfide interchange protein DsbD [Cycloclasticus pugetii]
MKTRNVIILCLLLCAVFSTSIGLAAEADLNKKNITDTIGDLFDRFSTSPSDALLEPDDAFKFFAEVNDQQHIILNWQIADGYYLYQQQVEVTVINPQSIQLEAIEFPKGKRKVDEIFGDTVVYYHDLRLTQRLTNPLVKATNVTLNIRFQGCADIGVCYPPMNKTVSLSLQPTNHLNITQPTKPTPSNISEQGRIAKALVDNTVWLTALTFLGFGLLLSLTPCVFPMIPILSGIIIGHGKSLTTRKAFYLSFSYVFASAITYALFGILAGLFGSNLQATFQNPWILSIFSGLFVLLALSMFGLYQIQLPNALQSKLSQLSQHQKNGSLWGSAIMGILSTLIVGPCVAAPLAGVLIYIGQTGDAVLGGLALFSLGLGMGIPLLIIGVSAGKLLPKAGHWMEPIKYFFGVLLLAVAIWLVERILLASITLLLWASLFIICAIYLNALDRLPENSSGWQKLSKGVGAILMIYGVILMLGAASGGSNPLKPLANFSLSQKNNTLQHSLPFKRIQNIDDLQAALQLASQNKQFVMLDFYADWCVSCKEMEAFTFSEPSIQQALKNTQLLQADVTKNNEEDRALLNAFSLIGPPAILFFSPNGTEIKQHRVIGYMAADDFLKQLQILK